MPVVLRTAKVTGKGFKLFQGWWEILSQQSQTTCCSRCRWQLCPSRLPGWGRDCPSSLRSSYHRESKYVALHWCNDSSRRSLFWCECLRLPWFYPKDPCVHRVDSVQTVISLQRVKVTARETENQQKNISSAAFWAKATYESVGRKDWKMQGQHATKNGSWPLLHFSLAFLLCQEKSFSQLILLQQKAFIPLKTAVNKLWHSK